jgi:glycosyltransferase involved in cell wall biosynthesis
MKETNKKIYKLERDLEIAKYQLLELDKVKYELESIKRSRFWKLREVFLSKHLSISQRIDILLLALPLVSKVYSATYELYLNLKRKTIVNTKEENPLISVVIPCYNYYRYLDDCINSVLAQDLGDKIEIIVIEGFSNDGSRDKLKMRSWPNTRIIFQDRRTSIGENRLKGIQESRGRYVCMIDADDMIEPNYFKSAIETLEREQYDVVYPDVRLFEDEDRIQVEPDFYFDNIFEFNLAPVSAVFRRSFWEDNNIGYSDNREIFEDWDFWMRMAKAGARFKHLHGAYLMYRIHTTTAPSVTDTRLKDQEEKESKTKTPYKKFIHSKEFYRARRRQNQKYKVINSNINITW